MSCCVYFCLLTTSAYCLFFIALILFSKYNSDILIVFAVYLKPCSFCIVAVVVDQSLKCSISTMVPLLCSNPIRYKHVMTWASMQHGRMLHLYAVFVYREIHSSATPTYCTLACAKNDIITLFIGSQYCATFIHELVKIVIKKSFETALNITYKSHLTLHCLFFFCLFFYDMTVAQFVWRLRSVRCRPQ